MNLRPGILTEAPRWWDARTSVETYGLRISSFARCPNRTLRTLPIDESITAIFQVVVTGTAPSPQTQKSLSYITRTMVRTRAITQPSEAEVDARKEETAATLVDVASYAKVHDRDYKERNTVHNTAQVPQLRVQSEALRSQLSSVFAPLSTTVGLGIDPCCVIAKKDATEAAVKAIRDAMERCVVRFPVDNHSHFQMHVKLGVPPTQEGQSEPMHVDVSRLVSLLPPILFLPVEIAVGGLFVPQQDNGPANASDNNHVHVPTGTGLCTAVACITLRQAGLPLVVAKGIFSPTTGAATVPDNSGTSTISSDAVAPPASWAEVERQQKQDQDEQYDTPMPDTPTNEQLLQSSPTKPRHVVAHSTSIEMLARISAEIHEQQPSSQQYVSIAVQDGPASAAAMREFTDANGLSNYNYKKLPPGMTPKNNKRLFVKHSYKDYSRETPLSEDLDLLGPNAPLLTPNAAFPLKLHETLTHIELDGHDDIIGWLQHGRSFKIHKQKEFVQTILPKYFVMTKKSSFLRQLNLYGFNRLSGIGPDQGSYYHEKFLRGLKFLSRRMSRQKVNGNGIRAAGNPDDEPNLSVFPSCPPTPHWSNGSGAGSLRDDASSPTGDAADPNDDLILRTTAGIQVSFPLKLQRILDKLEAEGKTDIISWLPHGRAFLVHDSDRLVSELLPVYFNQTRYSSFQRQLHMYNFQRITAGRDKGAYHHANFQRGTPQISLRMHRTRVNGKGTRRPGNPAQEPNFHSLGSLPSIVLGTKIEIPVDLPNVDDEESSTASEES